MPDLGAVQTSEVTVDSSWMRQALHDVSQPLTALECGLFLGTMSPDGLRAPKAEELLQTILEALEQVERVTTQVRAMQDRLNRAVSKGIGGQDERSTELAG